MLLGIYGFPSVVYTLVAMKKLKQNIDVNDDAALEKILNIHPKTLEYKDVINRGTKRVYGFISQQIAEIIPEAVSVQQKKSIQKGTLYDTCSNFECSGNMIHMNINDYEETYNEGDVLKLYSITNG